MREPEPRAATPRPRRGRFQASRRNRTHSGRKPPQFLRRKPPRGCAPPIGAASAAVRGFAELRPFARAVAAPPRREASGMMARVHASTAELPKTLRAQSLHRNYTTRMHFQKKANLNSSMGLRPVCPLSSRPSIRIPQSNRCGRSQASGSRISLGWFLRGSITHRPDARAGVREVSSPIRWNAGEAAGDLDRSRRTL